MTAGGLTCLDAKTGAVVWGPERTAQGTVSSSLVLADGKLYVVNENAVTTVIQAGPEYKVLATNELDGGLYAVVAGHRRGADFPADGVAPVLHWPVGGGFKPPPTMRNVCYSALRAANKGRRRAE